MTLWAAIRIQLTSFQASLVLHLAAYSNYLVSLFPEPDTLIKGWLLASWAPAYKLPSDWCFQAHQHLHNCSWTIPNRQDMQLKGWKDWLGKDYYSCYFLHLTLAGWLGCRTASYFRRRRGYWDRPAWSYRTGGQVVGWQAEIHLSWKGITFRTTGVWVHYRWI